MKFPRIIKAAKAAQVDVWLMADALLKEASGKDTGPNGLKAVTTELEQHGYPDYSIPYLRELRQTAETYPPNRRHADISCKVHASVRNPDTLDAIARALRKEGVTPSLHRVDKLVSQMRRNEIKRREQEARDAEREEAEAKAAEFQARKREENAKTADEKTKARRERETHRKRKEEAGERADRAKVPVLRANIPTPREQDIGELTGIVQMMAHARQAHQLAVAADKIRKRTFELSPASIAALTDAALTAANAWRELAMTVNSQFSHAKTPALSVVNE